MIFTVNYLQITRKRSTSSLYWKIYRLERLREMQGSARQGVHDLVKRCDRTLQEYEEKLHLVSRFLTVKEQIHKIREILDQEPAEDISVLKSEIRKISDEILEEL